jgi:hypothetical protein
MFDHRLESAADLERKIQRRVPEVARLDVIVKACGEGVIGKRAANVRPFFQLEAALRSARELQAG